MRQKFVVRAVLRAALEIFWGPRNGSCWSLPDHQSRRSRQQFLVCMGLQPFRSNVASAHRWYRHPFLQREVDSRLATLFIGVVVIFTGILMNLQIYFQQTSLFNTIIMIVLLAGGIGLIFRSLVPHSQRDSQ